MKHALTVGLAATFALISAVASAEERRPFTTNHPQLGVRLAYGVLADDPLASFNPYGLGAGLTVGYSFGQLYLGVSGEYYLGAIVEALNDEPTASIFSGMFEPGYDIRLSHGWMVRPQIGVGMSGIRVSGCEVCENKTEFKPAVAPGVMFMLEDFGGFYGQVGARYHHIFIGDTPNLEADLIDGILLNIGVGAAW